MNLIFLGYTVNTKIANEQKGASVAGNNMQLNILENLNEIEELNLYSVTIYPTISYPQGKLYINLEEVTLFKSFKTLKISFLNLPIIKQFHQALNLFRQSKKLIKKNNVDTILTFNMFPQISIPSVILKKLYGVQLVSILADPPVEIKKEKFLKQYINKIFVNISRLTINHCDKIIVLNKFAAEKFAPGLDYKVVQGGIGEDKISTNTCCYSYEQKIDKKIIFTGALTQYNGINELISAMKELKDLNISLDIYGDGPLKDYIITESRRNLNINYLGRKDNDYVIQKQREAFLLINPRRTNDEISKVTFPSKIFEYMVSGTPILSSKLNGFTDDYLDKMFFIDELSTYGISAKIREIYHMSDTEIKEISKRARDYIIKEKNWKNQSLIIYDFLKDVR